MYSSVAINRLSWPGKNTGREGEREMRYVALQIEMLEIDDDSRDVMLCGGIRSWPMMEMPFPGKWGR